jgi:hypothetical protein
MFFKKKEKPERTLEDMMKKSSEEEVEEASEETDDIGENAEKNEPVSKNNEKVEEPPVELNALFCFGWEEDKTEKWMIKCAKVWYAIMSFFWFLFGTLTFAPVIFISKKIRVVFKDKKLSLLVGGGIYALIVLTLVAIIIMRRW